MRTLRQPFARELGKAQGGAQGKCRAGAPILNYTKAPKPYRELTQAEECAEWLVEVLEEAGEPMKPKEIREAGEGRMASPGAWCTGRGRSLAGWWRIPSRSGIPITGGNWWPIPSSGPKHSSGAQAMLGLAVAAQLSTMDGRSRQGNSSTIPLFHTSKYPQGRGCDESWNSERVGE